MLHICQYWTNVFYSSNAFLADSEPAKSPSVHGGYSLVMHRLSVQISEESCTDLWFTPVICLHCKYWFREARDKARWSLCVHWLNYIHSYGFRPVLLMWKLFHYFLAQFQREWDSQTSIIIIMDFSLHGGM